MPGFIFRIVGRLQPQVQLGQQVQRHDRGGAEVGLEDIAVNDLYLLAEAVRLHVALRQARQLRIVFDADCTGAEVTGCGDRDLAVARTEVVHAVRGGDLRHLQHPRDEAVVGRYPYDVFAGLAGFRLVLTFAVRATGAGSRQGADEQQR